ncbi:hypothetical protein AC249_AIPGENE7057, partial [Exaiptasia diaphana]
EMWYFTAKDTVRIHGCLILMQPKDLTDDDKHDCLILMQPKDLTDDDKHDCLIFKEKPHVVPAVMPPHYTLSDQEMEKVKKVLRSEL